MTSHATFAAAALWVGAALIIAPVAACAVAGVAEAFTGACLRKLLFARGHAVFRRCRRWYSARRVLCTWAPWIPTRY